MYQTSSPCTGVESEHIPSVFSVGLCLLPRHGGLGMGDKRREWTLHTQAHPCRCRPSWQPLPGSLTSHNALNPADIWMEKALWVGFAKIIWKALRLPPVSRAARPVCAAAACLNEPSCLKTGLRLEPLGTSLEVSEGRGSLH